MCKKAMLLQISPTLLKLTAKWAKEAAASSILTRCGAAAPRQAKLTRMEPLMRGTPVDPTVRKTETTSIGRAGLKATPVEQGSGSTTIWVSPDLPLTFRFSGDRQPEINPVWLNALCSGASSEGGLFLISEKDAEAQAKITALDSQNN